ncbi:hypothetical protein BDB01DRAFT_847710 [Pilobolus umbonatus]|nr:hypothetical protein BDB01DRAFT_847710 [Pilobolus umbonatus]
MTCAFISFCGYLISRIVNDQPLIQILTQGIYNETETPDIEVCIQGSTWEATYCEVMYLNWSVVTVPDCWNKYFRGGEDLYGTRCYIYESHGDYRMTAGDSSNPDAVRRLDFYWNVGSIENMTRLSIAQPAVAIKLFHSSFNTWIEGAIGDSEMEKLSRDNIGLGLSRTTSLVNYSTGLFFYQELYRTIKKGSVSATFETRLYQYQNTPNHPAYVALNDTPFSGSGNIPRSGYQGYFSVQLAKSNIEIKEEVRQNTILASVALAGGCYGILTTLYILLFGMTRMTPWGLIHHVPVFINKKTHHEPAIYKDSDFIEDHKGKKFLPWFFRSPFSRPKKESEIFQEEAAMEHMMAQTPVFQNKPDPTYTIPATLQSFMEEAQNKQKEEEKRYAGLTLRMNELEIILKEYFINTLYLDEIREQDLIDPQHKDD